MYTHKMNESRKITENTNSVIRIHTSIKLFVCLSVNRIKWTKMQIFYFTYTLQKSVKIHELNYIEIQRNVVLIFN